MRFLFASDSFKGSLSSAEIIQILTEEAHRIIPGCETVGLLTADGGEGTLDAVVDAWRGEKQELTVHGPLMEPVKASYGRLGNARAMIEMAAASGLPLVPQEKRNPLYTTTYGTGELIAHALSQGITQITVAIGGSATNDGGMGAMRALGVRFLDRSGEELAGRGADLLHVEKIDTSGLHPAVHKADFTVMCDVKNPLTGPHGAAYTFGAQKGAGEKELAILEEGMKHYACILREQMGTDVEQMPGAGAAGGLGAALAAFLRAKIEPGIESVLDMIGFDEAVQRADLVITGEGRLDWQSCYGKVISGVGERAKKYGVPAIAVVGGMGEGASDIYEHGIVSIVPTVNAPIGLEEAMKLAPQLYRDAAERLFRMLLAGKQLWHKE